MRSIVIQGELTIYTAANEKQHLQSMLDLHDALEINLSQVSEIDTAGLQVLVLLKREAAKRGKKLSYAMHSKPVIDVLEMTNLTSSFGDQIVLT